MMQGDEPVTAEIHSASKQSFDIDGLAQRFTERVSRLGVTVERFASLDAVADLVRNLAEAVPDDVRRVVLAPSVEQTYPALRQGLEARGMALTPVDVDSPAGTFGPAAVGISEAMLGIAETGTYAVADSFADRLVRMLAHRHVVILEMARLVPSLDEAGAWLAGRFTGTDGAAAARYASFITGPSRTADIEMSLTVGAHGPAELRIVLLDVGTGSE
jgi:L-lactate dehydrogenase complex protein LldG